MITESVDMADYLQVTAGQAAQKRVMIKELGARREKLGELQTLLDSTIEANVAKSGELRLIQAMFQNGPEYVNGLPEYLKVDLGKINSSMPVAAAVYRELCKIIEAESNALKVLSGIDLFKAGVPIIRAFENAPNCDFRERVIALLESLETSRELSKSHASDRRSAVIGWEKANRDLAAAQKEIRSLKRALGKSNKARK
jgi:hypothetical protein